MITLNFISSFRSVVCESHYNTSGPFRILILRPRHFASIFLSQWLSLPWYQKQIVRLSFNFVNMAFVILKIYKYTREDRAFSESTDIDVLYEKLDEPAIDVSMRSAILETLANQLLLRFHGIGDLTLLNDAVKRGRESLSLCPQGHPKRLSVLTTLAFVLRELRLYTTENEAALDEAIRYAREAVALCSNGNPDGHLPLIALSLALRDVHCRSKDEGLISEALQLAEDGVSLCKDGHPDRDRALEALSLVLYDVWVLRSERQLLDQSILLAREVVNLRSERHELRARILDTLVLSLSQEYKQDSNRQLIQEYVSLAREAVALRPHPHAVRAESLNILASCLRDEYFVTEDEAILDESDRIRLETIGQLPQNHPQRYNALVGLSLALYERHMRTGYLPLLDEAIRLCEEARSSPRSGHVVLGNLCAMLCSRFDCFGDVQSLDAATRVCEEALQLRPPGHPFRVYSMGGMGLIMQKKGKLAENMLVLEESNRWLEEALDLCSPQHPFRTYLQDALATNLCDQYANDRDPAKNDRAIVLFRDALQGNHPGDPRHCGSFTNFGRALFQRYQKLNDDGIFEEALRMLNTALDLSPKGTRYRFLIFSCLCEAYFYPSPRSNMSTALNYFAEVINDPHAPARIRLAEAIKLLDKIYSVILDPCAAEASSFGPVILRAYQDTIALLPMVANFGLEHVARLRELTLAQSISSNGATYAIHLGEGCAALEILEDSRAVFWSQALHLRDTSFDNLPEKCAQELDDIFRALAQRGTSADSSDYLNPELVKRRRQSERAQEIIDQIRHSGPQFERFLLGHSFASLARAASNGPVIVLTANDYGCNALALLNTAGEWRRIALPDASKQFLEKVCAQTRDLGQSRGDGEEARDAECLDESEERAVLIKQRARQHSIAASDVLEDLWIRIVKPIIDGLGLEVCTHLCFDYYC
jgi:tetratricopeptide (TPR) repeat protein